LPEAHYQAAVIYSSEEKMDAAILHYKEAIRLNPDWLEPLNNLAWILATHPDENFRDGKLAVERAERACALTDHKNPGALDTLAAAYAEVGEFSKAIGAAEKAIELVANGVDKNGLEEIRARLELYRAQKTFRQ
jgi:tetratricopeptide (TPR) repeat protein